MKALWKSVRTFHDWRGGKDKAILTTFIADHEQWWWKQRPNIGEW